MRRRRAAWLVVLALGLVGAKCGGGDGSSGDPVRITRESPDARCEALGSAFPARFDFVPGLPDRVIVPEASRKQLSFFAQSIMSQIMHYRIFKPVLERMAVGDLTDRKKIRSIADHIARFSLRGLGCPPDLVEEAVTKATKLERDAAPIERAPK